MSLDFYSLFFGKTCFTCSIFGILTIQFWAGNLHYRCRVTQFPVAVSEEIFTNYSTLEILYYRNGEPDSSLVHEVIHNREKFPFCSDESGSIIPLSNPKWNQKTSPWKKSINGKL